MDSKILIAISDASDGTMSTPADDDTRLSNRTKFLERHGVTPEQTALVHLRYEGDDYRRYFTVTSSFAGDGIVRSSSKIADALFTTEKELALLLPVADCVAAVLYDPVRQVIGLAHLGRHNLVQHGGNAVVRYMQDAFATEPADLQVYLGPGAGKERYPLFDFGGRSLHEVAVEQLSAGGVSQARMTLDARDTTTDERLFSHSEYLQDRRDLDGRQAFVAMMRP